MLSLTNIIIYLLEGVAITIAIYLIAKKKLQTAEIFTLSLTIGVTFMILDMFAPGVAMGARQGAGFGLGFEQVAGDPNPRGYYMTQKGSSVENFHGGCGPCAGGRCAPNKCGPKCRGFGGCRKCPYKSSSGCANCPYKKSGMCPKCPFKTGGPIVEGMDDPIAIAYYQRWNPPYQKNYMPPPLDTTKIYQGAPRIVDYDGIEQKANEFSLDLTPEPEPVSSNIYNSSQVESEPESSAGKKKKDHKSMKKDSQSMVTGKDGSNKYAEFFSDYSEDPASSEQKKVQAPSQIAKKLRENPFDTTVRSVTEVDEPGAYYDQENIPEIISETYPVPILYSPLKPDYGYRYQLPRGWDELEQDNLYKAFNEFRNVSPDSKDCRLGPSGENNEYDADYHYQKKNF